MRKYLYYILKEDGRSGKVVNSTVTYTGTPTPLPHTPDGWQELQIAWERSAGDHGITRNFSLPFGFVRDGARIIRDAIYNQSLEEKLFLLIQTLTIVFVPNVSYNWLYAYLYKGELDLTAAEDSQDIISVPCLEGGLHKLVHANRATKYTFPFDLESVRVDLDGILLEENANYIAAGTIDNDAFFEDHTTPFSFVNREGTSEGTAFFTQVAESVAVKATYVGSSTNYFVTNESGATITYRLHGTIRIMCTENLSSQSYRWFLTKDDNTDIDIYNSSGALVVGQEVEVEIDETFALDDGEKMFWIGRYYAGSGGTTIVVDFLDGSELNLTFESTADAKRVKAYTKDVLYRKLIGAVTGDEANASSELCEEFKHLLLTSGDAIRGLPDAEITTSLNEFFDDVDATLMAGLGIDNGLVRLEGREYFYDESDPVDLGEIKDLTVTPATELICNKFKVGHAKPDIEDINGKYDPNGSAEYTGPYTKVVKEYNIVSPYKAGPYEIESLRLNLTGKVTTDDNRDNDVYVLSCEPLEPLEVSIQFFAAGYFVITSAEGLEAGQQIQISGSALNDGVYNIESIGSVLVAQIVSLSGTLVAEGPVDVTITILRGGVYALNRPAYDSIEGVPNDTVFNLPYLTPKTMLLRHFPWIRGMHYGLGTGKIKHNSSDKNAELKTVLGGVTIDEDGEETINQGSGPMFLPFYFNFSSIVPTDLVDTLELTPYRCFQFTSPEGHVFTGFLYSAAMAPNEAREQEFKLLAAPSNDLNLLVA